MIEKECATIAIYHALYDRHVPHAHPFAHVRISPTSYRDDHYLIKCIRLVVQFRNAKIEKKPRV